MKHFMCLFFMEIVFKEEYREHEKQIDSNLCCMNKLDNQRSILGLNAFF